MKNYTTRRIALLRIDPNIFVSLIAQNDALLTVSNGLPSDVAVQEIGVEVMANGARQFYITVSSESYRMVEAGDDIPVIDPPKFIRLEPTI